VKILLVTLTTLITALCVGLWWYLRLRRGHIQGIGNRKDIGARPYSHKLSRETAEPESLLNAASATGVGPDNLSATELSEGLGPNQPPTDQTLTISELTTLDSEEGAPQGNKAAEEQTDHPSFSESGPLTEPTASRGETSFRQKGDRQAQLDSQFSKADLDDLGCVYHDNAAECFASDLHVPTSVGQSSTASIDLIDQLAGDQSAERLVEVAAIRAELDESVTSSESIQEEKTSRAVSALEEPHASEMEALGATEEETSNELEATIELSDVPCQDISTIENEQTKEVPTYRPLVPPTATVPTRTRRSRTAAPPATNVDDLRLRLQLIFGRGGEVKLNLVADRREQMPDEVDVSLMQGKLRLIRHQKDCYEPVSLSEASTALQDGVEWRGRSDSTDFRWMLSRRKLHVLSEGDVSGLYHFGSAARLQLNAQHIVMAAFSLRDDVLAALSDVGCTPDIYDETTPGVPAGWLLFRNVIPTNAVPMRDGADILNALCPLPNVEPHFVGGIHLERNTWLLGYPPRIRLTGDLSSAEIKLDGQPIIIGEDGTLTAEGWDAQGDHRLWFGGQTQNYTLRTIEEHWQRWPAYDFGMGATICGASIDSNQSNRRSYQVIVPATNPLLIGATPGEVYYCHRRCNLRLQAYLTCVPFQPVWALPLDPAHAKRDSARILMLRAIEPAISANWRNLRQSCNREIEPWVSILNSASKKRLRIEPDNAESATLWQCYRLAAKQLRRSLH
jgi:hypothetical protein